MLESLGGLFILILVLPGYLGLISLNLFCDIFPNVNFCEEVNSLHSYTTHIESVFFLYSLFIFYICLVGIIFYRKRKNKKKINTAL